MRLGLSSRLNASTWCAPESSAFTPAIAPKEASNKLQPGEARIIRDETGAVIRIEHAPTVEEALDQEWEGITDGAPAEYRETTDVVRQLEALARSEVKKERTQSDREKEWIESLITKHGDDIKKMAKDRKLNPFQQTEGDIRRRIAKWQQKQAVAASEEIEVEA